MHLFMKVRTRKSLLMRGLFCEQLYLSNAIAMFASNVSLCIVRWAIPLPYRELSVLHTVKNIASVA